MRMILDAVDKRALQDKVSFGLTLVVHLGCSGCLMSEVDGSHFHRVYIKFVFKNGPLTFRLLDPIMDTWLLY